MRDAVALRNDTFDVAGIFADEEAAHDTAFGMRSPAHITNSDEAIAAIPSGVTVALSSYEEFLASENDHSEDVRRMERLTRFPYSVMLQVAYPEVDFANRWCWQHFGPPHGECLQFQSEYRACDVEPNHCHMGVWTEFWFAKTDYNFGFNEWYFMEKSHYDRFLASVPSINWGEHYSK